MSRSPHPSITREMCPWEKGRVWGFKDGNPSSLSYKTHLLQSSDVPWGCSGVSSSSPSPWDVLSRCVIQMCHPQCCCSAPSQPGHVPLAALAPPRALCRLLFVPGSAGRPGWCCPAHPGSPARLRGRGFRGAKPRWQERPPLLSCR